MPVYKVRLYGTFNLLQESLEDVIMPTIESLKKAITIFERQGGSVNVIICDDGLQLCNAEEKARRTQYYSLNNLAYVARPPHGQDGFLRRGRFKKAGNLNHCNAISLRIEEILDELRPVAEMEHGRAKWSETEEAAIYDIALAQAIRESNGRTWAAGNIRM